MSQQTKTARTIARYCLGGAIAAFVIGLFTNNVQLSAIGAGLFVVNLVLLFSLR